MSIVKEAFIEGRETDIDWEKSRSKQAEIKMEVFMDNMKSLSKKERMSAIPLQQICPNTREVLRTFPSRLAAAKWIIENILNRPNKNPISICGNMEICMRAGWKSYGYYWKICSLQESLAPDIKERNDGNKVFIRKLKKNAVFPSITEAAAFLGVHRTTLSKALADGKVHHYGQHMVQLYNPEEKTLTFETIAEAKAKLGGLSDDYVRKLIITGQSFNNYKIKSKRSYRPKVTIRGLTGSPTIYSNYTAAGKAIGVSRDTIKKYGKSGQLLKNTYRISIN